MAGTNQDPGRDLRSGGDRRWHPERTALVIPTRRRPGPAGSRLSAANRAQQAKSRPASPADQGQKETGAAHVVVICPAMNPAQIRLFDHPHLQLAPDNGLGDDTRHDLPHHNRRRRVCVIWPILTSVPPDFAWLSRLERTEGPVAPSCRSGPRRPPALHGCRQPHRSVEMSEIPAAETTTTSPPRHPAITRPPGRGAGARDGRERAIALPTTAIPPGRPTPPPTDQRRRLADIVAEAAEDGEQTGLPPDPRTMAALNRTLRCFTPAAPARPTGS